MDGLIIKKEWCDKIFDENKTLEIRGQRSKRSEGTIAIIQSKSGFIVGQAFYVGCFEIKNSMEFKHYRDYHKINLTMDQLQAEFNYKNVWAWRLKYAERFKKPKPYKVKPGAVIWVKDVL